MTYRFVREVVKFWDIPLTVLQVDINPELGQPNGYTVWEPKDIQTRMPVLKPFIDMVKKYGTPYVGGAFCTDRLKLVPFTKYCDDHFGRGNYTTWIGIRADEPKRLKPKPGIRYLAELSDFEKEDILAWWKQQPFDLQIRGRYAWSKDGTDSWFITDLEDESHPDRYSAQYRAESQPDGIIGIGTWRDFIVCFGSSTIEYFSLTGATTVGAALYVAQPSLMVQKGIAGTYCKTPFADSYAFISNPATGAPSVYIIGSGQVSPIASASIEKILRSYTADELADGVMESLRFDAHELLIIHLPRHVLVYDASSSANGPQWCVLKTGLYDDVYRAIDFIYEGNQITCGDKLESVTGKLQFDISSQYDKQQEHLLFTPLFKADNARVFDLEVESSTGVAQYADRLFLSATTDGINYGREQMIEQNEPFVYDKRVLWKRVGRIRKNVGFKLRVITKSPVTLSGCQIRIE